MPDVDMGSVWTRDRDMVHIAMDTMYRVPTGNHLILESTIPNITIPDTAIPNTTIPNTQYHNTQYPIPNTTIPNTQYLIPNKTDDAFLFASPAFIAHSWLFA